jgi:hypothetical protein
MATLNWNKEPALSPYESTRLFRWNDGVTSKHYDYLANNEGLDAIRTALAETWHVAVYHGCRSKSFRSVYKYREAVLPTSRAFSI